MMMMLLFILSQRVNYREKDNLHEDGNLAFTKQFKEAGGDEVGRVSLHQTIYQGFIHSNLPARDAY